MKRQLAWVLGSLVASSACATSKSNVPTAEATPPSAPQSPAGAAPTTDSDSLSKPVINGVVRDHLDDVKDCYERELKTSPELKGRLDAWWTIAPDGHVTATGVLATTTLPDKAVNACIVDQISTWAFPSARAQTTVGRYPFIFKGGD